MSLPDPIPLQNRDGLVFWPRNTIALVRREYGGRLEVTATNGEVAHRPGPLEALGGSPFIPAGDDALVNPRGVRRRGKFLEIPGGGTLACPARWPQKLPGTTTTPSRMVSLGRRSLDLSRLRAICKVDGHQRAVLENGTEMGMEGTSAEILQEALGLPSLEELLPTTDALRWLYWEDVRDWPFELYEAEASLLRRHFGESRRRLMVNAVWQAYRYRAEGRVVPYGTTIRGLWYVPVVNVLERAGLRHPGGTPAQALGPLPLDVLERAGLQHLEGQTPGPLPLDLQARDSFDPLYLAYETLLAEMIGEQRLFSYRELGMEEPRRDLHDVGTRDPHVVLYVEKWSLNDGAAAIVKRHGPSHIIMGGTSTYIATEFFVERLRAAGVAGPLTLMAYVDFDPGGWKGVEAFCRHLARYGMQVSRIGYLVRPDRFTPAELRLHALPLSSPNPQVAARNRAWVEASGGVNGKPRGIHADNLWPLERAVAAYEEEMREG